MKQEKFQIINYVYLYQDQTEIISVVINIDGNGCYVDINRKGFEFWLLRTNRLAWQITAHEGRVHRIEEVEGTMSLEEYWNGENILIENDMYDYIVETIPFNTLKNLTNGKERNA